MIDGLFCKMKHEETFYLGKITRLHGYKGAMILHLDVDDPTAYYAIDGVFIEVNGMLVPHFFTRADARGNQLIIELEGVAGEEAAMAYVNRQVHLPLSLLPKLSGKQFYFHEVTGFTIVDVSFGVLGPLLTVTDHPTNPLFVVDHGGKEVLIPMNDECLVEVDRINRRIVVNTPEGLIDLYLGGANERQEG